MTGRSPCRRQPRRTGADQVSELILIGRLSLTESNRSEMAGAWAVGRWNSKGSQCDFPAISPAELKLCSDENALALKSPLGKNMGPVFRE